MMQDDVDRGATLSRMPESPASGSIPGDPALHPFVPAPDATEAEPARALVSADLERARGFSRGGQCREAASVLGESLRRLNAMGDPVLRARLLGRLGMVETRQGYLNAALGHCREAYEVLRETPTQDETGLLELSLGILAARQGKAREAADFLECALFTFRALDHREGVARSMCELGGLLSRGPRWQEARGYLEEALALSEDSGDLRQVAGRCLSLGTLQNVAGDWGSSAQLLNRALVTFLEEKDECGAAEAYLALGDLMLRRRQDHVAESHLVRAIELAGRNGYVGTLVASQIRSASFHVRLRSSEKARALLAAAAAALGRSGPAGLLLCELKRGQARLHLLSGEFEEAASTAFDAAACAESADDLRQAGMSLRLAALALAEIGKPEMAATVLRRSMELLDGTPDRLERTLSHWELARLLAGSEEAAKAYGSVASRLLELDLPGPAVDALLERAELLASTGELDAAVETSDRASEILERLADPDRRQKAQQIRARLEERSIRNQLLGSTEHRLVAGLAVRRSPAEAIREAVEAACRITGSDRGALVWGVDPEYPEMCCSSGFSEPEKAAVRVILSRLLQEQGSEKPEPVQPLGYRVHVMAAPRWDGRCQDHPVLTSRIRAAVALGIPFVPGRIGMFYLDRLLGNPAQAFGALELRQASLVAALLSRLLPELDPGPASQEKATLEIAPEPPQAQGSFITINPLMLGILAQLPKIAESEAGVLITGETGTGKGLLTLLLHRASRRANESFVPINCAALPETLLESELYGHVRGAFTGAVRDKIGLFEEACGGTILLDEVDKTSLGVQAKLLHVLDRREIRPVGSNRWRPVDVRVICATNTDLAAAIESGRFLEDLFYRLNDFAIHIPPLRDRREDVPVLVRHYLHLYGREAGRPAPPISRETLRILKDQDWRGNVRELAKVIRRLVVLAEDGEVIGPNLLPGEFLERAASARSLGARSLRSEVRSLEARLIRRSLLETKGNKSEVARRLQMSYPSLLAKIKQYGLENETPPGQDSSR